MSSGTTDLKLRGSVEAHLNEAIYLLNSCVMEFSDINNIMYEVANNQCDIYGVGKDKDRFLLYRVNIKELREDTDLFAPVIENIQASTEARRNSRAAQKLFREFVFKLYNRGSNTVFPSFALEHGLNAKGNEFCHTLCLIGYLSVGTNKYKITFGEVVDFEHMKDCDDRMDAVFNKARRWCADLTRDNRITKLSTSLDGIKVNCLDDKMQVDSDDELPEMDFQDRTDHLESDLEVAKRVNEQMNDHLISTHQQRPEGFIHLADVQDQAVDSLKDAMKLLEGVIASTHPYEDRTSEDVYNAIRVELVPMKLGDVNLYDRENARKCSFKVFVGHCHWMIPIINDNGEVKSSVEILEKLKEIAYFGPAINDTLVHWVKRGVHLSTEFALDRVKDEDGKGQTKRVCTIGLFQIDSRICCDLADLSAMHEGDLKKRIEIPHDIYQLKPDQLIACIEENVRLFIEHELQANGCSLPNAEKRNDVSSMVEALQDKKLNKKLEDLGAKLYWKFLTPDDIPRSLKLYIDFQEIGKKRAEVFFTTIDFLKHFDPDEKWDLVILFEEVNTIREWGKGSKTIKDAVPPICIQMTWNYEVSESITNVLKFIDQHETSKLREFGLTTRSFDDDTESVRVELQLFSNTNLPAARKEIEKILRGACDKFSDAKTQETMVFKELDSSKPNTLTYVLRNLSARIRQPGIPQFGNSCWFNSLIGMVTASSKLSAIFNHENGELNLKGKSQEHKTLATEIRLQMSRLIELNKNPFSTRGERVEQAKIVWSLLNKMESCDNVSESYFKSVLGSQEDPTEAIHFICRFLGEKDLITIQLELSLRVTSTQDLNPKIEKLGEAVNQKDVEKLKEILHMKTNNLGTLLTAAKKTLKSWKDESTGIELNPNDLTRKIPEHSETPILRVRPNLNMSFQEQLDAVTGDGLEDDTPKLVRWRDKKGQHKALTEYYQERWSFASTPPVILVVFQQTQDNKAEIMSETIRIKNKQGVDKLYSLCAASAHIGSASSGHHFFYEKHGNQWVKNNDGYRTAVALNEVLDRSQYYCFEEVDSV